MDIVMGKATELVLDREAEVMEASSPERAFPFQVELTVCRGTLAAPTSGNEGNRFFFFHLYM